MHGAASDHSREAAELPLVCYDTMTIWHTAVPGFTFCGSAFSETAGPYDIGTGLACAKLSQLLVPPMVKVEPETMAEEMRRTFCVSATPSAQLM